MMLPVQAQPSANHDDTQVSGLAAHLILLIPWLQSGAAPPCAAYLSPEQRVTLCHQSRPWQWSFQTHKQRNWGQTAVQNLCASQPRQMSRGVPTNPTHAGILFTACTSSQPPSQHTLTSLPSEQA